MSVPKMITKPHKEKNKQPLMQQAKQKDTVDFSRWCYRQYPDWLIEVCSTIFMKQKLVIKIVFYGG